MGRTEADPAKAAKEDAKQSERNTKFEHDRIGTYRLNLKLLHADLLSFADYYSMVEGLVESEENGVAVWVKLWAGIAEDSIAPTLRAADTRRINREHHRLSIIQSLGDSITFQDGEVDESDAAVSDDESVSMSASGGSGKSHDGNKRRSALPSSFSGTDKDREGTRDRIKIFIKHSLASAQTTFASAIPATSPTASTSQSSHHRSGSASLSRDDRSFTSPPPDIDRLKVPSQTPKQILASKARKREGFLWASAKAVSHSSSGDGGGHWHK